MSGIRFSIHKDQRGFTLIETIVTIIISAVLAVVLAQVIANQTGRSYTPIQVINENFALRAVMENIAADCRQGASVQVIQARLTSEDYWDPAFTGSYRFQTIDMGCVGFNAVSGQEEAALCTNSPILKVTIAIQGTAHRLTSLFAQ
jgi:prepilin-type N-terminal cleavage/methylation domain-containing protein